MPTDIHYDHHLQVSHRQDHHHDQHHQRHYDHDHEEDDLLEEQEKARVVCLISQHWVLQSEQTNCNKLFSVSYNLLSIPSVIFSRSDDTKEITPPHKRENLLQMGKGKSCVLHFEEVICGLFSNSRSKEVKSIHNRKCTDNFYATHFPQRSGLGN